MLSRTSYLVAGLVLVAASAHAQNSTEAGKFIVEHMSGDDFIETDGGVHNIRVFGNRGVNAAHGGYSAQPVFGGPAYFIRNISYHVPSGVAFKFSAKPAGLFVYQEV